jgi:hypothetical protein
MLSLLVVVIVFQLQAFGGAADLVRQRAAEMRAKNPNTVAVVLANAKDPYRIIEGKTNSVLAAGFKVFFGRVLEVQKNGIRVSGSYLPGGPLEDTDFFVANFPYQVADGDELSYGTGWAAKVDGTYTYRTVLGASRTIHKLDYGTIYVPPPPAPPSREQIREAKNAAAKRKADEQSRVLKHHQELADEGDAYGQYRMGQRYLAGDGVERDLIKARDMFEKAAAQGHAEAKKELKEMERAMAKQ